MARWHRYNESVQWLSARLWLRQLMQAFDQFIVVLCALEARPHVARVRREVSAGELARLLCRRHRGSSNGAGGFSVSSRVPFSASPGFCGGSYPSGSSSSVPCLPFSVPAIAPATACLPASTPSFGSATSSHSPSMNSPLASLASCNPVGASSVATKSRASCTTSAWLTFTLTVVGALDCSRIRPVALESESSTPRRKRAAATPSVTLPRSLYSCIAHCSVSRYFSSIRAADTSCRANAAWPM